MFNQEELRRYNRHIILPEFGINRQEKLKEAKVLVIGAGGLGCPVLLYLATAGIGNITIIDPDTIDISNLQRQVLYTHNDIGKHKATVAAQKLIEINKHISVNAIVDQLGKQNAIELISQHDLVIDGSDNFSTRYLVNDACVITQKPLVFGSIFKFEGQVSVFNFNNGPTYRCVYPEPPSEGEVPSCSEIGVIGVLPGIIGVLQATEAIKIITGIGEPLSGKLLLYDALTNSQIIIELQKNSEIVITDLMDDYDQFCGVKQIQIPQDGELSPQDALNLITNHKVQIIDVRETWEYDICKIEDAVLITLNTLPLNLHKIDAKIPKLVYCHHGIRSRNAIEYLQSQGLTQLFNLKGGIDLWAKEISTEMSQY
jgi:sulfur-carrier protein adenylyltransferase/sulfurtransferase